MSDERGENIETAIEQWAAKMFSEGTALLAGMAPGFREGVKWADANPSCGFHKKCEKLEARIAQLEKMLEVAEMAFKEHRDNWTYPGEEHECASECGTICRAFASIAKIKESAVTGE